MTNHSDSADDPAPAPVRVLVVDEQMPLRLLCRLHLEAAGMAVLDAANGRNAVEIARIERPDVILLDVRMPTREGWDIVEQLVTDARTSGAALIFFSATAVFREHSRRLQIEDVDFLTKPFRAAEVAPTVRELVDQHQQHGSRSGRAAKLRE